MENIKTPTGNILIIDAERGKLECLSLGDYGKEKNVKADFLGLSNEINGVPNGAIMPLQEKWVVTISTQYGCSMGCKFCDVPLVGAGVNASYRDMQKEIEECLKLHPEVLATKRLNVHYARMGEPTFNRNVISLSYDLRKIIRPFVGRSLIHPVISTMMPKANKDLFQFLQIWTIDIKNDYFRGDAGLQLSINSTNDKQREYMFSGNAHSLEKISEACEYLPIPKGRKYALNFALADNYEVDADKLSKLFDTDKFMVKITPLHKTRSCASNDIKTTGGYEYFVPYKETEQKLKEKGFDVLVFVPSYEEDDSGITCGNAILAERAIE
jgi:23S rRNA (adenine2503-C2)-methyltransferase